MFLYLFTHVIVYILEDILLSVETSLRNAPQVETTFSIICSISVVDLQRVNEFCLSVHDTPIKVDVRVSLSAV